MKRYYKLTFKTALNKQRTIWCYKLSGIAYMVVDKGGDRLDEIVYCAQADMVSTRPAKMNLKYAELELIK